MNRTSTKTLIRRYVLENFLYTDDEDLLEDDVSFLENGVVDSTGVLELVMFVEDTFGIPVKDEEIVPENFDSVDRLAQYVESQAGKTAFIAS
ncbi:MAG: acyl carrier protein [Anaerolineae bacterium]